MRIRSRNVSAGALWPAIVVCAGAAAAADLEPPPAASLLPERTLVFRAAEDVTATAERFRETGVYKAWKEEEVQAFLRPATEGLEGLWKRGEKLLGFSYADVFGCFTGQIAFAVVGVRRTEDGRPWPEVVVLAEVGDRLAAERLLDRAAGVVEEAGGPATQTMHFGPVTIGRTVVVDGQPLELDYVLTPRAFCATLGPGGEILSEVASAAWGRPKGGTLAGEEDFLSALDKAGGRRDLFSYLAFARAWKALVEIVEAEEGQERAELARRVFAALGLGAVRSVSFSEAVDAPGFRSQIYVHAPAQGKGLFELLPDEPVGRAMLGLAPAGPGCLLALRLDFQALLPLLREVAGTVDPQAVERLDSALALVRDTSGIDLERELFEGLLGGEGVEAMLFAAPLDAPGVAGPAALAAGFTLVARAARPEVFGPFYEKLAGMATGLAAARGTEIREETTPEGAVLRYVDFYLQTTPTVTYFREHLVAGATKQAVARVCAALIESEEERLEGSFATSADYEKALARAGVTPVFLLGYLGPVREEALTQPLAMAPMAKPALMRRAQRAKLPKEFQDIIKMTNLAETPSAATLAQYSLPQVSIGWAEEDGVGLTCWTSSGVITPATVLAPVAAAVAVPYVERDMEQAARRRCMGNMQKIRRALSEYADGHGGNFPDKLEDLVPGHLPDASALSCPTTGAKYVYISGLKKADRANMIVAYEPPPGHGGGLSLLYVGGRSGGHVSWQRSAERIMQRVEVQLKQLREQGRSSRVTGAPEGTAPVLPDDEEEFF